MKFTVTHDFAKSQPHWVGDRVRVFGERNEGFTVEGESARAALEAWNAQQLPGARLNPFYLKIVAA